jgi:hypothetical protein
MTARKTMRHFEAEVIEDIVECHRCGSQAPLGPVEFGDFFDGDGFSMRRGVWHCNANIAGWSHSTVVPLKDRGSVCKAAVLCPTCGTQFAALLGQKAPAKAVETPKPKPVVNPYNKFEVE